MMTLKEKFKRTDSMHAHVWALSDAYLGHLRTVDKLMHIRWANPPQSILRHVRNAEENHWQLK